ncbi:MAG: N-6 DNA methylase [Oscillospiraceae bacterium]|nr:N-6 DNA methylase [Oscillospiraceae bacterium]
MMASIEAQVTDRCKEKLKELDVRYYVGTEDINPEIAAALKTANSKSGGSGGNFPDLQCLLDDERGRCVPVMIELKGSKGKLEKLDKDGSISNEQRAIQGFAVNGAVHYGMALLTHIDDLQEVIIIGINGSEIDSTGGVKDFTCKAYYISKKNGNVPKHISELDNDLTLLAGRNTSKLYAILDNLLLTDEEKEKAVRKIEERLEASVKNIHQSLYDDEKTRALLGMNEKLYLFCGLIMAGLPTNGVAALDDLDFKGNNSTSNNDGQIVLNRIMAFLDSKHCSQDKISMILNLLRNVFNKGEMWRPQGGISILKTLYLKVKEEVIPYLVSPFHLDFAGKILNSLDDWVQIENDIAHDVVLTPRYVTSFMARLCRTDRNSLVWDRAMGSAGFLVSAMDIMVRDAQEHILDEDELEAKIRCIKEKQLLGIEILGNVYLLAVLNMILMGDGSSNMICGDSHKWNGSFDANVFLLNPPYSAPGKGLNFVLEALSCMHNGYAAVLIQENAGAGQGGEYPRRLLENNTLLASIHMPDKLFSGKASVQTAVYVFKVNQPHDPDGLVKFIDFTNDGYSRQNRKKSTQEVNLRDTDNAADRYAEVEALVLGKKPKTSYYTKENGLYVEDVITLKGNDWTFAQHRKIDAIPTEEDFKQTVADYLSFKVSQLLRGEK